MNRILHTSHFCSTTSLENVLVIFFLNFRPYLVQMSNIQLSINLLPKVPLQDRVNYSNVKPTPTPDLASSSLITYNYPFSFHLMLYLI